MGSPAQSQGNQTQRQALSFDKYQQQAAETAIYPAEAKGLYPLMGLFGETAELIEKALLGIKVAIDNKLASKEQIDKMKRVQEIFYQIIPLGAEMEVLKKDIRKNGLGEGISVINFHNQESLLELGKEIGDQLWYQSAICKDNNLNLGEIAQLNLDKLNSRKERGVLNGSGDNR